MRPVEKSLMFVATAAARVITSATASSRNAVDARKRERIASTRPGGVFEDLRYKNRSATLSHGYPCLQEVSYHLNDWIVR